MRADELMHFPFSKEDCGVGCSVRLRCWRNVNLLYEVKFYRRKPHRFLQQEKVKKASCCRRFVFIAHDQTQPLILMNKLYFYIIEIIYEKNFRVQEQNMNEQ